MTDFNYKKKPFSHQKEVFERSRDLEAFALFWEMGTGKTKTTIDTAAWLYLQGKIELLLVVAPNGVHRNWVSDEIPAHLPDEVAENTMAFHYQASKAGTKWHQAALRELMEFEGLKVLAISYDAFRTKRGKDFIWKMMKKLRGRILYVCDESARIKTPKAKRTISVIASGKYANYRRILTGTPVANSPFDVYSQIRFLDPNFWKKARLPTFTVFKNQFGIWQDGLRGSAGQSYKKLLAYQKLEDLHDMVASISSRVTKDEVLDLPPKLYSRRYVPLSKEQYIAYTRLKEEYMLDIGGEEVTAILAITRLLRLQQIVGGYVGTDDGELVRIPGDNPRLIELKELCEDIPHKAIIWARFQEDINQIMALLGPDAVRYDGKTSNDQRADAIEQFQRGKVKFFVGNPAAAGEGLTLHAARTVVYYSNSFNLTERLQSEDRAHRIGQEHPVNYIDFIAEGTVDERIVHSLVNKLDIASVITGDNFKEWIR